MHGRTRTALLLGLVIVALGNAQQTAQQDPDVQNIIKRSVAIINADWDVSPQYQYKERDHDPDGTKTYEVMMIEGSPYRRLIEVNGKPLSPEDVAKQQAKVQQTAAQRRSESAQERRKRIAKYETERKRDFLMLQQLTVAFDFHYIGPRTVGPHQCWLLKATPKSSYKPPNMETQVLTGMQGLLWVEQATYHWVKVTAQVVRPVSIVGFLAEVQPGTRFEVEFGPVGKDIWQISHYLMRAHARILYMFNHGSQDDETYFDYVRVAGGTAPATPESAH